MLLLVANFSFYVFKIELTKSVCAKIESVCARYIYFLNFDS